MSKPDYSAYTVDELIDCKTNIDRDAWPERYQEILESISIRCDIPDEKLRHDQLVFFQFCEKLRDDLSFTIDDNLWGIFKIFSKNARNSVPSTFDGEVCPICEKALKIESIFGSWRITCENCELEQIVRERSLHSS
jgi:hypothetical protein